MIKLFIVDDHNLFRQGLIEIFKNFSDIKVIGEAATAEEFRSLYRRAKADIVLMDISLPDANGIELMRETLEENPSQKFIVLSMHDDDKNVYDAFHSGASGYFTKTKNFSELINIIRVVNKEGLSVPRNITSQLLQGFKKYSGVDYRLTQQELEILGYLKQGLSNKAIAKKIHAAEKTVKNHLYSIFQKLCVKNRTQAVVRAIEEKIILK